MNGNNDNTKMNETEQKIEIQIDPDTMRGTYSNITNIAHTQEEFILDFLYIQQQPAPYGKLVSKVILSPGHARRLLTALQDNIRKYEEQFGKEESVVVPPTSKTIQ